MNKNKKEEIFDDSKAPKNVEVDTTKGNAGNTGNAKGFDEQHGQRGTQLNPNTTANTGNSKHRGA